MESRNESRTKSTRILVVDNDESFLDLAKMIFEADGHEVIACRSGDEAWKKLRSPEGRAPDLILTDVMMPDLGGWRFHNLLLEDEETRHIPVIVVSAQDHLRDAFRQSANVVEFLIKPFGVADLYDACEGALGAHS